jgi:hypothetical protein
MKKTEMLGEYEEPSAPKDDFRDKKINPNDLSLPKMDYLKPGMLPTKKGKLKESQEKGMPEAWSIKKPSKFHGTSINSSAPSLNRRKAVKGEDNVKFGGGANVVVSGVNRGYFGIKKLGYAAVANPLQKVRFNKEVRQGKAYFGSNEGSSSADLATKKSSLKSDKVGLKAAIKDVKGGTALASSLSKSERIGGYRAEIKNINKDLRTTNKAGKYLSNLRMGSGYQAGATVNEDTSTGLRSGKIQYATPGRFEGFADSPQNKRVDKLASLKVKPDSSKINRKTPNKLRK